MSFAQLDLNKKYTYADYLKWQFEEAVELIRGRIFPMAAPLSNHQTAAGNLFHLFKTELKNSGCQAFIAPFDVRLPKPKSQRKTDDDIETVVQPDVSIICDISKIDRRGCLGAPDLVAEILSKSTASKDVKEKFEVYEEAGVREYWVVSFGDRVVSVYRLGEMGRFIPDPRPYATGDTIRSGVLPNFSITVGDIFEGLIDFGD